MLFWGHKCKIGQIFEAFQLKLQGCSLMNSLNQDLNSKNVIIIIWYHLHLQGIFKCVNQKLQKHQQNYCSKGCFGVGF
jgi:hypothetical protein